MTAPERPDFPPTIYRVGHTVLLIITTTTPLSADGARQLARELLAAAEQASREGTPPGERP